MSQRSPRVRNMRRRAYTSRNRPGCVGMDTREEKKAMENMEAWGKHVRSDGRGANEDKC